MDHYTYSVVMPAYNRAIFLPRAVRSVAQQDCITQGSIEILVIDDGSTDNTSQVIGSLEDEGLQQTIKYVKIKHIGEPGTVRNVALGMAQGDFLAYCDSDDYWLPHHLATAIQAFKRNPSLGMVSNFWGLAQFSVLLGGNIQTLIVVPPHPPTSVNTNCRVHRKECLKVGFFNTSRWGEDQDFFQRVEKNFSCYKTGIVTSINGYIKKGNNLTYEFDTGVKNRYF